MDPYLDVVPAAALDVDIDCNCPPAAVQTVFAGGFSAAKAFQGAVGAAHFQPPRRHMRYLQHSVTDLNRSDNHFQGVQRLGDHLLVTGADWTEKRAHLLVVRVARGADGMPTAGTLEHVLAIDDHHPHPGGCQRLGRLLIVPLEGGKGDSYAKLLHVGDPTRPTLVGGASTIRRPGRAKAGAAAITRLPDGRFLAGVWSDKTGGFLGLGKKSLLDLYLSAGTDVRQGWLPQPVTIDFAKTLRVHPFYQAIAFLGPEAAAAPGGELRLWMLGLRNTGFASNYMEGKNQVDLLEILVPQEALGAWGAGAKVRIRKQGEKTFKFGSLDGNFAAGGGVDVEADGRIAIYAAHHWRDEQRGLPFSVCRSGG